MELHEQFSAWLAGPEARAFTFMTHDLCHIVIRVRKNADFDYLYFQRNFNGSALNRGESFQYAGIYCGRDGLIYDRQPCISKLAEEGRGLVSLYDRLEADVRAAVEATIGNDRRNLRVTELTDECKREHLEHFVKYSAASQARKILLSNKDTTQALAYRCAYQPPQWTEDSLLAYILDPEAYASREAAAYLESKQEDILAAFMRNSAVAKEYVALMGNPRNLAHCVKAIMQAMSGTAAKTVRVTIRKNGVEFTFKTEAYPLQHDCSNGYYSTYKIVAADRREYERLFGRDDYGPEHILRIEYGRAVIYEAEVGA